MGRPKTLCICPFCLEKLDVSQPGHYRASHGTVMAPDKELSAYYEGLALGKAGNMPKLLSPGEYEVVRQSKGVVLEVRDREGYTTRNRVCPYCHNSLPKSAGRQNTFILPVFGAKGAGKSSYIAALAHNLTWRLNDKIGGCFLHPDSHTLNRFQQCYENPLYYYNHPPNPAKNRTLFPVALEFRAKKGPDSYQGNSALFLFYHMDIENMEDSPRLSHYQKVMGNASGLIYLVDPTKPSNGTEERQRASHTNAEWNSFFAESFVDLYRKRRIDVPAAIVLTKGDLLKDGEEYFYQGIESNPFFLTKKVDMSQIRRLSRKIENHESLLETPEIKALKVYFRNRKYFLASCYTCSNGAIDPASLDKNNVEAPFLWLCRKLGVVNPLPLFDVSWKKGAKV